MKLKFSKSDWLWTALLFGAFIFAAAPDGTATEAPKAKKEGEAPKTAYVNWMPFEPMLHPVRIGIATRASSARVAVWTPGAVFVDNKPVALMTPQMVYQFSPGRMTELATGRVTNLPTDRRWQVASGDYRILANNRWWRGSLEIVPINGSVTVINLLDLEDYLQGVVPSEMPASWHLEALKAQAVAARSYAYAHLGANSKWNRSEGYDLVPDVRDQAYKGLAAEAPSTRMAVWQTRGIILKDSGKVKAGFYRATVGDNPYENLNIRKSRVADPLLEKLTGVKNIVSVTVKQFDSNFNAHSIQVIGAKGAREVSGIALAKMLGFSTAGILDVRDEGNDWVFTYRGPGNGVRGLSQNGANAFAKNGWQFSQILHQYYQDPDGKLRLDYMDYYQPAMLKKPPPPQTGDSEPVTE